jgi:hypothetical protein
MKLKDGDPIDTLDTEVMKISKRLAETRKGAMAKLTSARRKPVQPDPAPPGFNKFKSKWKGAETSSRSAACCRHGQPALPATNRVYLSGALVVLSATRKLPRPSGFPPGLSCHSPSSPSAGRWSEVRIHKIGRSERVVLDRVVSEALRAAKNKSEPTQYTGPLTLWTHDYPVR